MIEFPILSEKELPKNEFIAVKVPELAIGGVTDPTGNKSFGYFIFKVDPQEIMKMMFLYLREKVSGIIWL